MDAMRIVMLSPISPLGDFYLLSVDVNGENAELTMKNVRTHENQIISDPFNTMHVQLGWKLMHKSYTPVAILEFHGTGRVQMAYIRSVVHIDENETFDVFFYEFRNQCASFTTPKIKKISDGLGYEIIVHFCRDGQEFLRILDCSGYLDTEFNWIGDIPLSGLGSVANVPDPNYRAYRGILGIGYGEVEENRFKASYLVSRFNAHRDIHEHLQLVKVYYTDPKDNRDRTIPANFQAKIIDFAYNRYVTQNELTNDWRSLRLFCLDPNNDESMLPKALAIMKIQYTGNRGIKYKISLKGLPIALKHIDFDDPYPELSPSNNNPA